MTRIRVVMMVVAGLALTAGLAAAISGRDDDGFDHFQHRKLFPMCTTCHAGVVEPGKSDWPTAASCASCHDGEIQKKVSWTPRQGPLPSNLRFAHATHADSLRQHTQADSVLACAACHTDKAAGWMQVELAVVPNCLSCHGVTASHLAAPDSACATCHLPLTQATAVAENTIREWPKPPSHDSAGFGMEGHGKLAKPAGYTGKQPAIAASCAVCHARDYCIECHVNAPEVQAIQALGPDRRSLVWTAKLEAPASHAETGFLDLHGRQARKSIKDCQACHTRESCTTCHVGQPTVARALYAAGPGRGPGAKVVRKRPDNHAADFSDIHAEPASAKNATCNACHVRNECLDCHRPNAAAFSPGYHPANFLQTHPAAAYSRASNCSNCHNNSQFCQACHQQSGLASSGPLGGGYHDAAQFFAASHGQAARQSLETCVSCHTENDCLKCHSATQGRRVNPHGPGFDPETMAKKNIQMCGACHGSAVPGVGN